MSVLDQLFSKLRNALKNPACGFCLSGVTPGVLFCPACKETLGFTPENAAPLVNNPSRTIYAATQFNPRLRKVLYGYKFYGKDRAALLSDILIQQWQQFLTQSDCPLQEISPENIAPENIYVVPIPARGENRHLLPVTQRFASDFGYNHADDLLVWARKTEPQHTLTARRKRWENMSQSLSVCGDRLSALGNHPQRLNKQPIGLKDRLNPKPTSPKMVLIIDDMMTTGATLHEASEAFLRCPQLPEAGFSRSITGLAISKVPLAFHRHQS